MGYDPNEARDYHGRWTDSGGSVPGYMQETINKNLLQELTPEEQQLLNKDYGSEQEFRQAAEKLIAERQVGNPEGSKIGSGSSGSGGGDSQLSEQEKIRLKESVNGYVNKYGSQFDLPGNTDTNVVLDENRSKEIALAYEKMPENDASNPKVKDAYNQLVKEVNVQYDYLTKDVGIKTTFSENDPYANSKEMVADVVNNKQLRVYSGGEDHPLLGKITTDVEIKDGSVFSGGKNVGTIQTTRVDRSTIEIDKLYLNAEDQRQGIGKKVINTTFKNNPDVTEIKVFPSPKAEPYFNRMADHIDTEGNRYITRQSFNKANPTANLTANEKFRAVHDYFGHAVEQNQFGKLGEEKAWVAHSKMFSPLAQSAMTTETRGQNSWVNFSGVNEKSLSDMTEGNKMIKLGQTLKGRALVEQGKKEFKFAVQKVSLLPERFYNWKVYKK